jgi:hypothetical protein
MARVVLYKKGGIIWTLLSVQHFSIVGVRFQELGVFVTSAFALGVEYEAVVRSISTNSYKTMSHITRQIKINQQYRLQLPITELGSAPKAQIHLWLPGMSNFVKDHCDEKYLGRKLTDNLQQNCEKNIGNYRTSVTPAEFIFQN